MEIRPSRRLAALGAYAFAAVDARVAELRARGIRPIDFGVGDPTVPTPERIRRAVRQAVDARAASGYPSYVGSGEYRRAVAGWMHRRFGVSLDPETEICSSAGSKEAIFHFPEAILDPEDVVICPSPGYPPWSRGTLFAEGRPYFIPLTAENAFLPDLGRIPVEVLRKARILWVNYPNNPTGAVAPAGFYEAAYRFCRRHGLILASDEAYTELYYTETPPPSALSAGREGVIVFQSLSKRSAMTTYRIGFVCGDARLVSLLAKVKTNVDSGTPTFIQDGAVEALADESHVAEMRARYRVKRDLLVEALSAAGLERCEPAGAIYIWQKAPRGMTSVDFAERLLDAAVAVVTTPGDWISDPAEGGANPGEGYVRFALVPSVEEVQLAADRIRALRF